MAPKVLVSDKLSETAVQIFRERGIDVDFLPDVGKDKDKLAEIIGQYDGGFGELVGNENFGSHGFGPFEAGRRAEYK